MSAQRKPGTLSPWQRLVEPDEEIPAADMTRLFHDLLGRLGLRLVVDETPDYTAYSIEEKPKE